MTTYSAHFDTIKRLKRPHGYLNIAITMIEEEKAWLKFPVASTATGVSATLQMHQALTFFGAGT